MIERLDKVLVKRGLIRTRSLAQDAIALGQVLVNQKVALKSSMQVEDELDEITICQSEQSFASRAGKKLYDALQLFDIDLQERIIMDVGASTGGFSDVCLKAGAQFVYALDVGHDQLLAYLRDDPRIKNLEGVNCRYLTADLFEELPNFACIDVSFISIKSIIPSVLEFLVDQQEMVLLIKPQFEAGPQALNKHGIIRDIKYHRQVLQDMLQFIQAQGLYVQHLSKSTIKGRDGNQEFMMHVSNVPNQKVFDIFRIVAKEI